MFSYYFFLVVLRLPVRHLFSFRFTLSVLNFMLAPPPPPAAQNHPKWRPRPPQRAPKTSPKGPQDHPKRPPEAFLRVTCASLARHGFKLSPTAHRFLRVTCASLARHLRVTGLATMSFSCLSPSLPPLPPFPLKDLHRFLHLHRFHDFHRCHQ